MHVSDQLREDFINQSLTVILVFPCEKIILMCKKVRHFISTGLMSEYDHKEGMMMVTGEIAKIGRMKTR